MAERRRKTHIYLNHSPITGLVIKQILQLPAYAAHKAQSLVISTRGQTLGVADVEELCFGDEQLVYELESIYEFFHDAPAYRFEGLTVFVPQTSCALGRFLLNSTLVKTVHYIEEGTGTLLRGQYRSRIESSTRGHLGRFGLHSNSVPNRIYNMLAYTARHVIAHPRRMRHLGSLLSFHRTEVHFIWRPEWHPRIGKLFGFHEIWPASQQTLLRFPVTRERRDRGATALLLMPSTYVNSEDDACYHERLRVFFDGLPPHHHILVKCHPSDAARRWLQRAREIYGEVHEMEDANQEPAQYCYTNVIPFCFHFKSSAREYFKFLPLHEGEHPSVAIDLSPASLRLIDILAMDPALRPSPHFAFPLPTGHVDDA